MSQILTSKSARIQQSQELRLKLTAFTDILSVVGVKLSFDDDPHSLTQEQALVLRDLDKCFSDSPERVYEFVRGLKAVCKKEKYFKKALLPTWLKRNTDSDDSFLTSVKIQQDSLFRILLKSNHIQKDVINILLDEIAAVASKEEEDTSWLRLLLNCLRYLPHIAEPRSLTTKLLDVLDSSTSLPVRMEILECIPEIIPDSQYGETAKHLVKLLDNEELSPAVVDCLGALNLDAETRAEVQDHILATILSGTTLKNFPVLVQFLLTDHKSQNLVPTLLKIRTSLDSIMSSSSEKEKDQDSCKILIFTKLQAFAVSPRTITEAWLNMVSGIRVHSDHKPIDYLILFMLHTVSKSKKRIIEAIFKKRLHMGLFQVGLLEKLFERYIPQQLLREYFPSMIEIGCSLLQASADYTVVEFVTVLFTTLFNHKHADVIYRKELLDGLLLLTGVREKKSITHVLKIITALLRGGERLRQHTPLLMRLLETLDSLELRDVKEVFEILCTLTCGERAEESMSGLKDEIHIVVRKQLSSSKRLVKNRGIIAAVTMAKHLVLRSEEQRDVDLPSEQMTLANIPRGPAREAATLLELANTSIAGCPELMGLFYDQLTSILIVTCHFDKFFMAWLHETITMSFRSLYVVTTVPEEARGLRFSKQMELNDADQEISQAGINVAGMTVAGDCRILLLASRFRLMRLLHYRFQAGDLHTILGLLGCGVIMPDVEDASDLDPEQVTLVADCLFHCINWFRELINGYVTQKNKKMRVKAAQRLQDIIDLEKRLYECMERAPDHKLPVSYFDSTTEMQKQMTSPLKADKKGSKKKFKSAAVVSQGNDTVASTSAAPVPVKKKKPVVKTQEFQVHFREMDSDLVVLLRYPLRFDEQDPSQFTSYTCSLNIDQVKFILGDYVAKLRALTEGKNIGLSHLNVVAPISIISDSVIILPNIDMHLKVILKKINKLLEITDGRHDLPDMYTEEAIKTKTCFGYILDIFYLTFNWAGFQFSTNRELLKNILKSIRPIQTQTANTANRLVVELLNRFACFHEQCLQLSHAVSLIKTMEALCVLTGSSPEVEKKITTVTEKLLGNRWYNSKGNLDAGKECNTNISILVKVYLKHTDVKTLGKLVGTLEEQASTLNTKEDCLHMLASIDKQNLHIFYAGICNALLNRVKVEIQSLTNHQHLVLWRTVAMTMQSLMVVSKLRETNTILATFLKKSIGILNVFLSQGIPILEIMLRSKPDEVVEIFKMMQNNTRYLHTLCCYSKLKKEKSLMALVPKFRMTLETFVYRAKAALVANNCSTAFWIGNLRNKDLHGDEILSQDSSVVTDNDRDNSEEELPTDESDVDVASDSETRESEVFD